MTFEEELKLHGQLVFPNKGTSMMPLLRQNRDLMVIDRRGNQPLKKYDTVLFKRDNGQYVLHRILKIRENDYLICGDNCCQLEPVRDSQILGILTAVVRDEKTISVTDPGYRFYVHLWCDFYPIRALLIRMRSLCGWVIRKIFHNDR